MVARAASTWPGAREITMPKPTIVLVHGAWADGSSWNAVASELQSQGYPVLIPTNRSGASPVIRPSSPITLI